MSYVKSVFIKNWKFITATVLIIVIASLMPIILTKIERRNDLFDRDTGAPLYGYSKSISGKTKIVSLETKYDTETGEKTKPLTTETLQEIKSSMPYSGLREMSDMYKALAREAP